MPTKILKCIDCGDEFTWSEGEQEFYASKGLQEPFQSTPPRGSELPLPNLRKQKTRIA
jgi:Probable zinc-ribbon domain